MTLQVMKCRAAGETFMDQAFTELSAGDLRQASEKGWGAAAQMVKAVAEQRGWRHGSHEDLFVAKDRIVDEIRDSAIRNHFLAAAALHTNFYEGWFTEADVRANLDDVQKLVRRLQLLLDD